MYGSGDIVCYHIKAFEIIAINPLGIHYQELLRYAHNTSNVLYIQIMLSAYMLNIIKQWFV